MIVKNHMESVVERLLPVIVGKYDICQCERCMADIKAIALNYLEPKYFTSDDGEIYYRVNEMSVQFDTDVTKAITFAIDRVKSRPKHNRPNT
ncbi:late competence development ComFB family protein [Serpentinicella sp. ANB-PHB4]|uniref:late competence development ComFB family protein n=1 Tax=Serpentinicella sp. ANB-PHB4 TaxID=3074076 RepID=UPI00286056BD|nr:late competence development ComFB family protein [Serpentinicella sp. ANB-PHB4]MDR5658205.1 late competence development ComFB family protein [Serpentinicella sp. ANB-PHB4]